LADSTGNITDNYIYSPYGALLEHLGSSDNSFLFTGEQYGFEEENYYLRARYYSPNSGRFLTRDSYDGRDYEPATLNHYGYAHGNPVNYTDPSGHMILSPQTITMLNFQVGLRLANIRNSFVMMGTAGNAFYQLGLIVERQVASVIRMASSSLNIIVSIDRQRRYISLGPGGNRVLDYLIKVRGHIAKIEVKYKLPSRAGKQLDHLIGQMQTFTTQPGKQVLFTFKEPTIQELQLVTKSLESAGVSANSIQFVNGYRGLAQWFALHFPKTLKLKQ